jgi:hypothetical protein
MQRRSSVGRAQAVIASTVAGLMALTLAALAQSPKIGDPPEAKNMRLVGYNDLQARSAYRQRSIIKATATSPMSGITVERQTCQSR